MFRIRRIYETSSQVNREIISQVLAILQRQFPLLSAIEIAKIPEMLMNPSKFGFKTTVYIAEKLSGSVEGFAVLMYDKTLNFCFLDFLAIDPAVSGSGIGGTLYESVRYDAIRMKTIGLFFECLPDSPRLSRDPAIRKQNAQRLKFYERYGAYPIINTLYETPLSPDDDNPPYLMFDPLDSERRPERRLQQKIVRAILERKYGDLCPPDYINRVVSSFKSRRLELRPPQYLKNNSKKAKGKFIPAHEKICLVVNTLHKIHHVRERGYIESPVRIKTILDEILPSGMFSMIDPRRYPEKHITAVHDKQYFSYMKTLAEKIKIKGSIYPYVFPIRNRARPPRELYLRAGYYCIDTFTPISINAFKAALGAVNCALTGADSLLDGFSAAYALIRPPGHHAEINSFGGFCYFNSAAIAAQHLSRHGKVAMLDIDYHHGNGQQDIFYKRSDVLTVSIHGNPNIAYPYFSGFSTEQGEGDGTGFNVNFPLPESITGEHYLKVLQKAIDEITRFNPRHLIVCLGFDTARNDPTGSWLLEAKHFYSIGRQIAATALPVLFVQEGGYNTRNLGINAKSFFQGFIEGR